jgi:AcrR family transcriptional regulator
VSDTKAKLVDATVRVLAAEGLAGTSARVIAATAGVN